MIVRSVDGDNDWNFGKGKSDYRSGDEAIAQNIKTRLMSFVNDCFFDMPAGLDWWNLLGSKNLIGLRIAVRQCILETDGVNSLVEVSTNLDENRNLSISYEVTTMSGAIIEQATVLDETFNLVTESGYGILTEDGSYITI